MISRRTLGLGLVWLLLAVTTRAEEKPSVTFSGESRAAALRLAEARKQLGSHKWSEAIETLQTILHASGDDLVPLTAERSVRVGQLCRIQLASLPADALRLYRQRYENQADKIFQQARAERDVPVLGKLVEDAFGTRAAEKAIDLLGDLAFERGRFDEAEEWWRLIAPLPDVLRDAATRGHVLLYPDPSLDRARLQAKQLLAQLFRSPAAHAAGSPAADDWAAALDAYRERYAKVEGTLAGRKGRYVDLLAALAEERKKQGDSERADWPTFGGDPSRGRVIAAKENILDLLSELCRDGPTWTFDLRQGTRQEDAKPSPAVNAAQARTLAFHPVIAGHRVLVADASHVTAFDLHNGKREEWCEEAVRLFGGMNPSVKLPAPPDLRYTLTVTGDRVYARLGAQDIGLEAPPSKPRFGPQPKPNRDKETLLVCLKRQTNAESEHYLWAERGIVHANAFFEGAPLAAGGQLWIASTRYQNNRCIHAIACYADSDALRPPLWHRDVCETREIKAGEARYRHHLLTLAGTRIVYCTHSGAIVAVDARTGQVNWAMRYPRRMSDREEGKWEDLAPVLFAEGRLYVAPADSDTLLCLDPATGRTLWERQPRRIVHLLGVGQGRLIFTTPKGLQTVKADDGGDAWSFPQEGELTPAGRGLLLGDLILFPTTQTRHPSSLETVVYAVRQSDGRAADDPAQLHRLPAGNLAYANGCLVVADRQTLSVFVPPRLRLRARQAEAQRHPDSAPALLELARAEADAGLHEKALGTLHRLDELLRRKVKTNTVKKLLAQSLTAKQKLLLAMAQRAAEEKRWQDAENALDQAAALPLSPRYRLHALLRAAQIGQDTEQTDRAKAIWKSIRMDESLRTIPVIDRQGRPISAPRFAPTRRRVRDRPALPTGSQRNGIPFLPLFRSWHVRLEKDEWVLAGWQECDPELLLTGSPDGRFICRLTSTGEIRWQHRLPFAPCWAVCRADTLLVAGEEGVAGLHRDDGELLWHFPAPAANRSPRAAVDEVRVLLDPQPPEPLTAFRLASGRLFFLQGQRRLFALNAETGAVLWDRWAPDGQLHLPFPRGCFSACYHAGAESVLVQMSSRRWLLNAASGRQIHEAADSRDLWQRPPLPLDERTLCLTPDNQHVALLDARTGQCLWTYRPDGGTIFSGEMPSVIGRRDLLFHVQPANIGYYLQRLDRASGKPIWSKPHLLSAKELDVAAWAFDSQTIYSIEDDGLTARSVTNGEVLWRRPLQGTNAWQVRRVGDYLAVAPRASVEARIRFRSPLGTVQWDLGSLLAPEAFAPLSCYDPKTGQLVQRLNLRIASPLRTTWMPRRMQHEGDPARIVRTSSLLASTDGPVIRLASPRPFVAIGGEVWGLNGERPASAGW